MLDDIQAHYQQKVSARAVNRVERAYSCLCCRDQVLIPSDIVRRYIDSEFDAVWLGEIAFFCQNPSCDANNITVNTEKGPIETCIYAADTALDSISPGKCKRIHQLEWKRMRTADEVMKSATPLPAEVVNTIAKPMQPTLQLPAATS